MKKLESLRQQVRLYLSSTHDLEFKKFQCGDWTCGCKYFYFLQEVQHSNQTARKNLD
ncbi:MAG: hypothetical protein VB778_07130 [Nitrospinaceae bacterium]